MNDLQLQRYSRHILLDEIGIEAQERLNQSKVLVIGAGGLGSPVLTILAAAGVGDLYFADADTVDLTNLQRQTLHATDRIGQKKVDSAFTTLRALNPLVRLHPISDRLQGDSLTKAIRCVDLVLDCSDNFLTRHETNRNCVALGKTLISGAAVRWSGQLMIFDPTQSTSPCYHCVFPESASFEDEACGLMGVFSALTQIIGSLQAAQALQILGQFGQPIHHELLLFDALGSETTRLQIARDPDCPVCGHRN